MGEQERLDAIMPGTVAIAGIMAMCNILAAKRVLTREEVIAIRDFMAASVEASRGSQQLQLHMRQAVDHHFDVLLEALDAQLRMET